ncbi:VOC family protein [Taibaiella sp. KBW10]|uniref:SMU1112c/YaeR family gloxylase I-like metalloprotein n=1 Tax=Taibaiella sp. KBW10 TaxID=2153357 RepID=UPI000F5A858B|nr:VOC family protein [Taibaiella sp. KBW10]RQO32678.1 VOC family protein [Taibaiella sp. KBW10]
MISINRIHHIAIICSDYQRSKTFYTEALGFTLLQEQYRAERDSFKADLSLHGQYIIELFSFPDPPERPSHPEARGLRHLAFEVDDLDLTLEALHALNIAAEPLRIDAQTGKRFTFIADPDYLPIEFYEK